MAVFTKISTNDLNQILDNYKIGKLINYFGIKEGIENTNYFLKTTKGKFILTIFESRVEDKDIPFFVNVMNHLHKNKILCPQPVEDNEKKIIKKFENKFFIIVRFLEGKSLAITNEKHCFMLGKLIGSIHSKSKNFQFNRKNSLSIIKLKNLYNLCNLKINKKDLLNLDSNLLIDIEKCLKLCQKNWPKKLPKGLIHGDIFPDNIFFKDEKISGIIDFYFSCNEILMYEIAIAINAWCFDKNNVFNMLKAKSLLKGYNIKRKITDAEMDCLPILLKGAALRFLLTRVYDWFFTPNDAFVIKKDPIEYLKKLRFFNKNFSYKNYVF